MKVFKLTNNTSVETSKATKKFLKKYIRENVKIKNWNCMSDLVAELKSILVAELKANPSYQHVFKETDIPELIGELSENIFEESEVKDLTKAELQDIVSDKPEYNDKMNKQELIALINPKADKVDTPKETIGGK